MRKHKRRLDTTNTIGQTDTLEGSLVDIIQPDMGQPLTRGRVISLLHRLIRFYFNTLGYIFDFQRDAVVRTILQAFEESTSSIAVYLMLVHKFQELKEKSDEKA